jgi:hypothetical protein
MRYILFVMLISCSNLSIAQDQTVVTNPGATMLKETFDQDTQTGLAKRLLDHKHITLAEGAGPDGSDAIRVAYVGYNRGSERIVVRFPLDFEAESATLSFDVFFEKDFQWILGGKLHGLGPKRPLTGGERREPDKWSARIMWGQDGRCQAYLYDQDETKKWGVSKMSDEPVFTTGQWHSITLQVSLNTPGKANGYTRIFVDGKKIISYEDVEFRRRGGNDTRIQQFLFSTFHGGNTPEWAPVDETGNYTTVYAYFDNFMVVEGIQQVTADDDL